MIIIEENKMDISMIENKSDWFVALTGYESNQERVFIPHGVNIIDCDAFNNNHHAKEVYLPESVKIVFKSAFKDCKNLESIFYKRNGVYKRLYKLG